MVNVERTCRYGHGRLELLMGYFALTGVHPTRSGGILSMVTKSQTFVPNGQLLALKVWRCPDCGYVELIDEV